MGFRLTVLHSSTNLQVLGPPLEALEMSWSTHVLAGREGREKGGSHGENMNWGGRNGDDLSKTSRVIKGNRKRTGLSHKNVH